MQAGYYEEAQAWREWLLRAVAGDPDQLQIMYGIGGERRLDEWEADWLPGYEKSAPVRIGNAAHTQLQLDVFGEIMDTYHQARRGGLTSDESGWAIQIEFLKHLKNIWRQPDQGIWEMRGPPQQFHLFQGDGLGGVRSRHQERGNLRAGRAARRLAQAARRDLQARSANAASTRSSAASCRPTTPISSTPACCSFPASAFCRRPIRAWSGTIAAIEQRLVRDGFVMRYSTEEVEDALPPGEGAFLACSFWLVDAYILQERLDDAERLFRRLVALRNDVGLLSEQYDPAQKRLVGNFPQAFSHLALINSAYNLTRTRKPVHQRAHDEHAPPEPAEAPAE